MRETVTLTGMVLLSAPSGDFDRRLVLLTRERGKITAFSHGARKPGNPLMAASRPFCFGNFNLYEGRNAYNLQSAQITNYFDGLSTDMEAACYGSYFLETAAYFAQENLDAARRRLMDILCNYAGYKRCIPILVFDAYKVRGGVREVEKYHNLYVVYTKEAETADMYIERATHELAKERRTRVVSSDGAEQVIVLGHGALRVSARAFAEEVAAIEKEIREFLQQ